MADFCIRAALTEARLDISLAVTTETCKKAQTAHKLRVTSAIALGRLLTSVGLLSVAGKRKGLTSIQFVTRTTLRQLFADADSEGHLRGFTKNPNLAFPLFEGETVDGRRSLAPALKPGELSVIRTLERTGEYTQSSTPIMHGEVDEDIEFFLEQSDQVATALSAEVITDTEGNVERASGVLVQALPDGDLDRLTEIRERLRSGALRKALVSVRGSAATAPSHDAPNPQELLERLIPGAHLIDTVPLSWRCRCSMERALTSLRMLSPTDLAEMIDEGRDIEVHCDFCEETYVVVPDEIRRIFAAKIQAQG